MPKLASLFPFQDRQKYDFVFTGFVMTDLVLLYKELNNLHFDAKLPTIPVVWNKRLSRSFGRCQFRKSGKKRKPVKIDIRFPMSSEKQLKKTLVHEMCHVWAFLNHGEMGHGQHFWLQMARCGYPDGHFFPDEKEHDRYQLVRLNYDFGVGEKVWFTMQDKRKIFGIVLRINRRTITIKSGKVRYRVSPSLVSRVE